MNEEERLILSLDIKRISIQGGSVINRIHVFENRVRADERERSAKMADSWDCAGQGTDHDAPCWRPECMAARDIAATIRATDAK